MPPTGVVTTPPTTLPAIDPACPSTSRHGDCDAYRHHRCRCPEARRGNMRVQKQYRMRRAQAPLRVEGTGVARRIEALLALGWPREEIARRLGVRLSRIASMRASRGMMVFASTARRVSEVYDQLADRPGPNRITAGKARGAGYALPIAWDDDTIDNPAAKPYAELKVTEADPAVVARLWAHRRPELVRMPDAVAFIREAHARGLTDAEIGRRLGWDVEAEASLAERGRKVTPQAIRIAMVGRVNTLRRRHGIGRDSEATAATDEAA